ncbi:aspartate dehydrogenase [Ochrobactrum sp. GPK 3]|uniref:aspartate dehydrogenase n=1 Tax=Brucella sp. 22210 TaxID=3453892 RepID=UPI0031385B1C
MRLGLIGYGNIARTLVELLRKEEMPPLECLNVLTLPDQLEETERLLNEDASPTWGSTKVFGSLDAFIAERPDLVVECAGHAAVCQFVPTLVKQGVDTIIVSIGALADGQTEQLLRTAADAGRGQIILPAGAVGGIDILASLRHAGLNSVTYCGRKPPAAWTGTPAEDVIKLADVSEPVVFFKGNARQAAQMYPKNANVAATLALAGLGFENTQVELIADPFAKGNLHEYSVEASVAKYRMQIENLPSSSNAKTSVTTVYSVLRAVLNRAQRVVI